MWLSAFTLRSFAQAKGYVYVDPAVLTSTAVWIVSLQQIDGVFPTHGRVIHTDMKGGAAGSELALTAYVTLALLEYIETMDVSGKSEDADVNTVLQAVLLAIEYIEVNYMHKDVSVYGSTLLAFVLTKADRLADKAARARMMTRATDGTGGKYWNTDAQAEPGVEEKLVVEPWRCHNFQRSADVEATAYALLAMVEADQVADGLKVAKWLTQSRKGSGGWQSTQDTVIALEALSEYAAAALADQADLIVNVSAGENDDPIGTIELTEANFGVFQTMVVPVPDDGTAPSVLAVDITVADEPTRNRRCKCATIHDPVCGDDGAVYSNACAADCAGVGVSGIGDCKKDEPKLPPLRGEGEPCGYGYTDLPEGFFGNCTDGLDCKCVGSCADPGIADAPSTCTKPTDSTTNNGSKVLISATISWHEAQVVIVEPPIIITSSITMVESRRNMRSAEFYTQARRDKEGTSAVAVEYDAYACAVMRDGLADTGMAVIQVDFLSGYALSGNLQTVRSANPAVKLVEDFGSGLAFYVDNITNTPACVEFTAVRVHKVAKVAPAQVKAFDYYELGTSAELLVSADPDLTLDVNAEVEKLSSKQCNAGTCRRRGFRGLAASQTRRDLFP
jgi:hypothetical protein